MKLIITNDGMFGVDNGRGKGVMWFDSQAEACVFGEAHSDGWIVEEFIKAVDECRKYKHDVAEFGRWGTLMYTSSTDEEVAA